MQPFDPVTIGNLRLRNRLVMAPVKTALGDLEGKVTDRLIAYYRRRARGGVGAIIVEPLYVATAGKEHPKQLGAAQEDQVSGLRRLVDAIHAEGAAAIAHINHAGRAANPKASGTAPEAPSVVPCGTTGATPEAMTIERIRELVGAFEAAAGRLVEAGFDAIEVQCGLGYLVAQFYSPRTNRRTDDYGGTPEKRERFAREVLEVVQRAAGGRIPVVARVSGAEKVEGGLSRADTITFAKRAEALGVAAVHVVSGSACDSPPWYYQHMSLPDGVNAEFAGAIKAEVGIPVIAAGRLGEPEVIDRLIGDGTVDLVALGRPLVADPDLPRKMRDGKEDLVLLCGGCLQGCLAGVKSGQGIGCIVNPEPGHEGEAPPTPSSKKRVVVVGAGPAGLTLARVAAERGHEVVLLEKSMYSLGGQFGSAYLAPGKRPLRKTLESMIRLARSAGADIRMGIQADADTVAALKPDVAVVATGAEPISLPIPGVDSALTGEEVLTGKAEVGQRVLIIGGGLVGIEVAEYLAERDHEVVVVEMLEDIARDMEMITRKMTLARLKRLPVTVRTQTKVVRIDQGMATVVGPEGEQVLGPFDTIVVAAGTRPNDPLSGPLTERGLDVHVVGDAKALGQVQGAVRSAWEVARHI